MTSAISNIFIVEDDALIAMLLEDMLDELGYKVSSRAANLEDALALATKDDFDAAILDVSLAGKSSLPVALYLDEIGTPYLFATGYGTAPDGGRNDQPVLSKPYQLEQLGSALTALAAAASQRT